MDSYDINRGARAAEEESLHTCACRTSTSEDELFLWWLRAKSPEIKRLTYAVADVVANLNPVNKFRRLG
jgi:hypothetical protein